MCTAELYSFRKYIGDQVRMLNTKVLIQVLGPIVKHTTDDTVLFEIVHGRCILQELFPGLSSDCREQGRSIRLLLQKFQVCRCQAALCVR